LGTTPSAMNACRLGLLACAMAAAGCADTSPRAGEAAVVEPRANGLTLGGEGKPYVVDLGKVPRGSSHSSEIRLMNRTPSPIRVDGFNASCECTSVTGLPIEVPAGGHGQITVVTNLAKEPDFTGSLAVNVKLQSGTQVKGVVEMDVTVLKSDGEGP
jgi:hypothetical protein